MAKLIKLSQMAAIVRKFSIWSTWSLYQLAANVGAAHIPRLIDVIEKECQDDCTSNFSSSDCWLKNVWEPYLTGLHGSDHVTHALLNDRNVTLNVDTITRIVKEVTLNSGTNLMPAAQQGVNNVATGDKQEQSVSHFFQEIGDDVQHCGADKRVGSGAKGEQNTPVSKETKRNKPKK